MKALLIHIQTQVNSGQLTTKKLDKMLNADTEDEYAIDKDVLEQIQDDIEETGSISSAVFEKMMQNNEIKADVLREFERIV